MEFLFPVSITHLKLQLWLHVKAARFDREIIFMKSLASSGQTVFIAGVYRYESYTAINHYIVHGRFGNIGNGGVQVG